MAWFSSRRETTERREGTLAPVRADIGLSQMTGQDAFALGFGTPMGNGYGPNIDERIAMTISAVFSCVAIHSGLIAGIPLKIYQDMPDGGRVEAVNNRLWPLLSEVPYPGRSLTSFAWRELWAVNTLLWGNHYSVIRYDGAARVVGFEPVMPWNVQVLRDPQNPGVNLYRVAWPDARGEEFVTFDDMIHLAGPNFDGICGLSRIQSFARNTIALQKTTEDSTATIHENASRPSGLLTFTPAATVEGRARQKAHFEGRNTGRENAGRIIFSEGDTKYTPFQMSPADLNTIESRHMGIADICRFFGIPPVLVGESVGTTAWGTGVEQLIIAFKVFHMEAEFQRIEHELNHKLFFGTPFYARFDRAALLAMDAKSAAEVMATQINSAQLTPNEARRSANRPAMPDGDNLFMNSATVPLTLLVNPPPPPAPPAPPEPAPAPAPKPAPAKGK